MCKQSTLKSQTFDYATQRESIHSITSEKYVQRMAECLEKRSFIEIEQEVKTSDWKGISILDVEGSWCPYDMAFELNQKVDMHYEGIRGQELSLGDRFKKISRTRRWEGTTEESAKLWIPFDEVKPYQIHWESKHLENCSHTRKVGLLTHQENHMTNYLGISFYGQGQRFIFIWGTWEMHALNEYRASEQKKRDVFWLITDQNRCQYRVFKDFELAQRKARSEWLQDLLEVRQEKLTHIQKSWDVTSQSPESFNVEERESRRIEFKSYQISEDWVENKWVHCLIRKGKKSLAERVHLNTLALLKNKALKGIPRTAFYQAIEKARPSIEVKKIRKGGATHRVPVELSLKRQYFKVFEWLREAASQKKGQPIAVSLANEITAILKSTPTCKTLQKRDELHQLAEKNREFAHYRW
jgi:small subunit ribosomal protein S7